MDAPRISLTRQLSTRLAITCAVFAALFILETFARLYLHCSGMSSWWGRVPINQKLCVVFSHNLLEAEMLRFVSAIAVTQVLKVAVVGVFCAIIFHRGVTRHISAMASYLKHASTQEKPGTLKLLGTPGAAVAELHDIEMSLNAIVDRIHGIRRVNASAAEHDDSGLGADSFALNRDLAVELERMSATCEAVTSILHDVNNGLSILLNNPAHIERLMSLDNGVTKDTKEGVGKVLETQERIVSMMAKLIATQQAKSTTDTLLTKVSLSEVVSEAVEIEGMRFVRAGIVLEYDHMNDFVMRGSKEIYMSILMNLLKNAREAILTSDSRERVVRLRSWQEKGKVVFEISDSGCGIAPEKLPHVGNHGFSTKVSGQGFGLAGARRMLENMNGWLTVESPGVGLGTIVKIGLPAL